MPSIEIALSSDSINSNSSSQQYRGGTVPQNIVCYGHDGDSATSASSSQRYWSRTKEQLQIERLENRYNEIIEINNASFNDDDVDHEALFDDYSTITDAATSDYKRIRDDHQKNSGCDVLGRFRSMIRHNFASRASMSPAPEIRRWQPYAVHFVEH